MPFFAVQTRGGSEHDIIDEIVDMTGDKVSGAIFPPRMKAYIIVEADNRAAVNRAIADIPTANKVVSGETSLKEVEGLLAEQSDIDDISVGSTVEITDGPYEGEIATVTGMTPADESVTVELNESAVPIPIELPGKQVHEVAEQEKDA